MTRTLTAIIFALSLGAFASTASAMEGTANPGGDLSFPTYEIVNG